MKRIWILDEGSQGHVVQSRGLVRELAKEINLQVIEIPARLTVRCGFAKSIAKRLLLKLHWKCLFRATHEVGNIPLEKPDLIISSGPRSMLALEHLSNSLRCPSIFVQGTVDIPQNLFTAVIRPFEGQRREDFIFIPLLFTSITPEGMKSAKDRYLATHAVCSKTSVNTLLIGASSVKIRFSKDDWIGVIRMVNELWKRDGSQWLISTSSRSGHELENLLKNGIDPDAILDAVWYSQDPRKVANAFLGMADRVFVTMDSLTMLSEAVVSGCPTCALCPTGITGERSNTHLRYVLDLAANGYISLLQPNKDTELASMPQEPKAVDYSTAIGEILSRLKWNI